MKNRYFYSIIENTEGKKGRLHVAKDKADVIIESIEQRMFVNSITELTEEEYHKIKIHEKLHSR